MNPAPKAEHGVSMSGWSILIRGMVCFTGTLFFLRLVAYAIADTRGLLELIEEREERLYKQRIEGGVYLAPSVGGGTPGQWADTPVSPGQVAPGGHATTKVDAQAA